MRNTYVSLSALFALGTILLSDALAFAQNVGMIDQRKSNTELLLTGTFGVLLTLGTGIAGFILLFTCEGGGKQLKSDSGLLIGSTLICIALGLFTYRVWRWFYWIGR